MAGLNFLEKEIEKRSEQRMERPAISAEELEHASRITENYRKIIFSQEMLGDTVKAERPAEVQKEEEAVYVTASVSQRAADDVPAPVAPAAPAAKHRLFEGLSYKDGVLIKEGASETLAAPEVAPAPAPEVAPVEEIVAAEEPAAVEEDDALPTRRTMETLRLRAAAAVEEAAESNVGFWAALSPKVKAAVIAVAVSVVMILAIVFANAAILNSLDVSLAEKRVELEELVERSVEIGEEIEGIIDPANVDAWAAANGMFQS